MERHRSETPPARGDVAEPLRDRDRPPAADAAPRTVLIVEDDERIASFMTKAIRAHGFEVEWVTCGRDAVDRVRAGEIDVQILDLGLPDIDGMEVLRELAEVGSTTPAIVVTARTDPRDRDQALALGARDYLMKPFPLAQLMASIRTHCGTA
jgi:DNA-binding response OmpR family regulator